MVLGSDYILHLNLGGLTLELQLILDCLRASLDRQEEIPGSWSGPRIDWPVFLELVNRHRVIFPVFDNLKLVAGDAVPEPVFMELRNRCFRNKPLVLLKTAELVGIVQQFGGKKIPVLPLKGPVVAKQAYGDIGARHVGDLDLLVSRDNISEAENILYAAGYQRIDPGFELTPRQSLAYVRTHHHYGYFCPERGIRVELHWRFGESRRLFPVIFSQLWQEKQTIQLGGAEVPALSLEDTILLLCVHGSAHAWFRLFWLNDLARLIMKNQDIDWGMLMGHAERYGIRRMVAEGVLLAHGLLGSPMPEPVRVYIQQDKGVYRLAGKAIYLMKHLDVPPYGPLTRAYLLHKYHALMLRSELPYKLAASIRMLGGVDDDWQKVPLPDAFFPVYFFLRPFLWFFRRFVPSAKSRP